MFLMTVKRNEAAVFPPDSCSVISAGAEAGGASFQAQHLRRIRIGQLRRPVHQRAHPAHTWWWVSSHFILSLFHPIIIYMSFSINWCYLKELTQFSFVRCSDVVKKIDQSEFEGFEYINPLLMSAEECVWETRRLCSHTHHPHTHTHSCTCYVVFQCPQAAWLWDNLMTSTFCSRAAHAQ